MYCKPFVLKSKQQLLTNQSAIDHERLPNFQFNWNEKLICLTL